MKTISQITGETAEALPDSALRDLPMIRTALNDAVDAAVKSGEMTERQANNWSQSRAVNRVMRMLEARKQWLKIHNLPEC